MSDFLFWILLSADMRFLCRRPVSFTLSEKRYIDASRAKHELAAGLGFEPR